MADQSYDIVTVGGGLAGASLARAVAGYGARVLVLERETEFTDRVRGEQMSPWGIAEAQALGIYDLLLDTCGHHLPWFDTFMGPQRMEHRDLRTASQQKVAMLAFYHPTMQEVLLQAAADAGAEVRRGVRVRDVKPGAISSAPSVIVEHGGRTEEIQARLVVGTDGRTSLVRKWAGFTVQQDADRRMIGGVLFEQMPGPRDDTNYLIANPNLGQLVALFPQGEGQVRAYVGYQLGTLNRFQGEEDVPRFIEEAVKIGAAAEFFSGVKSRGPLATFSATDTWVRHPYKQGVVLVGDAAASNDPSFGQGLSLTVRDVRTLRDQLIKHEDWDTAGHAYAEEHDRYYHTLHTVTQWFGHMFYEAGPEADACRAKALPLIAQDTSRIPDVIINGPDVGADETVRRRFFGEE